MKILVIKGGFSREREISLRTGGTFENCVQKLGHHLVSFDLTQDNMMEMINLLHKEKPDLVLNALHGTFGEDGTIQSILDAFHIPYSHSSALASSIAMDKVKSKIIFEHFHIPTPAWSHISIEALQNGERPLPMPFVMKAIAEGSTFGVFLINTEEDLHNVLNEQWIFGEKALLEAFVKGRELTVSILDGDVLGVAEIKTDHTFYDYESKYTKGVAERLIPAPLSLEEAQEVCMLAKKAHDSIGCTGLTRSDFIYDGKTFYILEINTQPGFTETSFAPLKAKQRGWTIEYLVSKMIESALPESTKKYFEVKS